MKVALDAMGGDHAPQACVAGAVLALREFPKLEKIFLVGDESRVRAELEKNDCRDPRVEIVHASQVVEMSESAVDGVFKGQAAAYFLQFELRVGGAN